MDSIFHDIIGILLLFSSVLFVGLIRPMFVIWWSTRKTRAKVLKVYGSLVFVLATVFMLSSDTKEDVFLDTSAPKNRTQGNANDAENTDQ